MGIPVCYSGPLDKGEEVLRAVRTFGPPLVDQIAPMPYTVAQAMLDDAFPRGRNYYLKGRFVKDINADLIDVVTDHFETVPSPFTALLFQQLGNAANRVPNDATAFSYRDARYDCVALSGWNDPTEAQANIQWTRTFFDLTEPFSSVGMYVNSVMEQDTLKEAYRSETYTRLVALKDRYDPTNFFRLNPNIAPSS